MSTSWPPSPLQFDPWQAVADGVEMTRKVVAGAGTLSRLQSGDVAVAPTPKDAVLRVDNATLYGRGHIGMYVSGKVQRELPDVLSRWILERD
jgi:hypothetical protein